MMISVKVITRARQEKVERQADGNYKVWVRAAREKGKANERLLELLSKELGIGKTLLRIVSGRSSGEKLVAVE